MTVSSLIGGACYICLLLSVGYTVSAILMALCVIPGMVYLAFGWNGLRTFLLRIGLSLLSVIILDGTASAILNLTGIHSLYLYSCILVLIISQILVKLLISSIRMQKRQMRVTISNCGRSVTCMGLYDSGNLLKMPQTGEPVHIISSDLLKRLLGDETPQWIPYQSLGMSAGTIAVYKMEHMTIEQENKKGSYDDQWVGRADEMLLKHKTYQVILNSSIVVMK